MAKVGLSGIASGVDTGAIVDQLMALERAKLTRHQLRQRGVEAQATGLRDVQARLKSLKTAAEALRSPNLWSNSQTAESSASSRIGVERTGMAPAGGHSISVRQLAAAEQEGFTYTPSSEAAELKVDGRTVAIAADASVGDLAAAINAASDLPVYATALGSDKIVFTARRPGTGGAFDVTSDRLASDALHNRAASDAEYSLDGGATWRTSSSNVVNDAIVGLRLTLKSVAATPETINVGVAGTDTAAVRDKLKAFVSAYNDVVTSTRAKVDERTVRGPRTAGDAGKGQLFGDSGLNSILSRMRVLISEQVAGLDDATMDELAELGISTGKGADGPSGADAKLGKLVIDETRLSSALDDPARVRTLLGGGAVPGFAQKIEQLISGEVSTGGVLDERLKISATESARIRDRVSLTEQRLESQEKRLRAQFAAMEKSLGLAQSQQAWLAGQINSLNRP